LRHVVGAQDGQLWRVHGFDFAGDIIFAERASLLLKSATATTSGTATATRPALPIQRTRGNNFRCPTVIRRFLPANENDVSHLEVSTFGGLPIFPKLRLPAEFHVDVVAIGVEHFHRPIAKRGDLAEKRQMALIGATLRRLILRNICGTCGRATTSRKR
jgi:hypothetical protein